MCDIVYCEDCVSSFGSRDYLKCKLHPMERDYDQRKKPEYRYCTAGNDKGQCELFAAKPKGILARLFR